MAEFTSISIDTETKAELDKQRNLPQGEISANEFLKYLLKQNKEKEE